MVADAQAGRVASIAVVGGGAGGVEMLLAMQFRLQALLGTRAPRFLLVTDALQLPAAARHRIVTLLQARNVAIHAGSAAAAIDYVGVTLQSGISVPADRVVVATSAAAAPWLAATGLACDAQGFLRVDRHLRSVSHPSIFAAGDCAGQDEFPRPKSGVFAVRQGPVLAGNLRAAMSGAPLESYVPQRHALALIATGGRHAIAVRGGLAVAGGWVWRWKDRIDRRFVARYRPH
jgi:selenide,water dikinase